MKVSNPVCHFLRGHVNVQLYRNQCVEPVGLAGEPICLALPGLDVLRIEPHQFIDHAVTEVLDLLWWPGCRCITHEHDHFVGT